MGKAAAMFFGVIIGSLVLASVATSIVTALTHQPAPAVAPRHAEDDAATRKVLAALGILRSSLRDPTSLRVESIQAPADGSIACVRYSARNGFGGVNREAAVISGSFITREVEDLARYCSADSMRDFTALATLL